MKVMDVLISPRLVRPAGENATPAERTALLSPEPPSVAAAAAVVAGAKEASAGEASNAIDEARVLQQPRAANDPPAAKPEAGSKRRAEMPSRSSAATAASSANSSSSSGSSSPIDGATPSSKVARLAAGPGTAAVGATPSKQQQKLEYELTESGARRYNICGMRFEVTAEYELTRAVGQVGHLAPRCRTRAPCGRGPGGVERDGGRRARGPGGWIGGGGESVRAGGWVTREWECSLRWVEQAAP